MKHMILSSLLGLFAFNAFASETVNFPGYGEVKGDLVCVTPDGKNLKALIAEKKISNCLKPKIEVENSTIPQQTCLEEQVVSIPAKTLVRPVTLNEKVCQWTYKDSDLTHPVKVCKTESEVPVTQELAYTKPAPAKDHGPHEKNTEFTKVRFASCQE